jgi:hypothetical protein
MGWRTDVDLGDTRRTGGGRRYQKSVQEEIVVHSQCLQQLLWAFESSGSGVTNEEYATYL